MPPFARKSTAQVGDAEDRSVAQLEGYLVDWQGLLRGHVRQAQQVLRRLVKGRLTFTPHAGTFGKRPFYSFEGVGTYRPLIPQSSLLSQLTTATRPSGNWRERVAPVTWYEPTSAGVPEVVVLVDPLQFATLPLPLQFTFVFEFEFEYPGTTYV